MLEHPKNRDRRIRQEANWPRTDSSSYQTEIRVDALSRLGGGNATAATRAIGASGSIVMPVLSFAANADNSANFEIHIPEELNPKYPARLRVMWVPGASYTTGNYYFTLDYLNKDEEDISTTGTPTVLTLDISTTSDATLNNTRLREDEFATDIWTQPDYVLSCRFWRDVSEDNGDDVAHVRFFELHYWAFRTGGKMHPAQKPW